MRVAMTILAVSLALSACNKKKEGGDTTGSAMVGSATGSAMAGSGSGGAMMGSDSGSAMAGSGSGGAMAGSGDMAGSGSAGSGAGSSMDAQTMAHHAGNCPSTVLGATTKVAAEKDTAVIVTITATDKDAIKAIHARTDALMKGKQDQKGKGEAHDQKGTHGGGSGMCPVFLAEGSTGVAKRDPKGVTVMITPKDKATVPALVTEIESRITKAGDWVKANVKPGDKGNEGGVGGGKGDDGSNHSGKGDAKGIERKKGDGSGAGNGTGGGKGKGGGKK